jgi:acetyl esterase/lipase
MRLTFVAVDDDTLAETRAANDQMAAAMAGVRMEEIPPAKVRAARESGRSAFPLPVADPRAETPSIAGPAGDIPLRIIRAARPDGVFLHMHGGGFTYGSPREYDDFLRVIVDRMNLTVVSVDYRLAPEHPFPAGADDCEAAALWFFEHAADLGGGPLFIGGESAGANLVVVTLLRLRDRHGLTPFAGAHLCYGWYDLGLTPSMRNWGAESLVLSTPHSEWLAEGYAPGRTRDERRDPAVSPLHASLHDLPPAQFSVGTRDALVDDTMFIATRWWMAGNDTTLDVYPEGMHGFDSLPNRMAAVALDRYVAWVRAMVDTARSAG